MSKWKPEVLVLVESPFGAYDTERYGMNGQEQPVDMTIADLTALIKPEFWKVFGGERSTDPRIHVISSVGEFRQLLTGRFFDAAIDEIGSSPCAKEIRRLVIDRRLPRVRLRLGLLPGDLIIRKSIRERFIARRSQLGLWRLILNVLFIVPRRFRSRTPAPDLVLGSGSETMKEIPRGTPVIWAHSFDFEKARQLDLVGGQRKSEGAVFLDQNLGYHPDQMHSSLRSPVSTEAYYPQLRKTFDALEQRGITVGIALHPKSGSTDPRAMFGDRSCLLGASQSLIRDAELVLCHASASLSYAVIWRKPVLFLTSGELEQSWYHGHIHEMSRILRRPVFDIDELSRTSIDDLLTMIRQPVDENAYASYEERFIRSADSPEGGLWETFAGGLTDHLAWRR